MSRRSTFRARLPRSRTNSAIRSVASLRVSESRLASYLLNLSRSWFTAAFVSSSALHLNVNSNFLGPPSLLASLCYDAAIHYWRRAHDILYVSEELVFASRLSSQVAPRFLSIDMLSEFDADNFTGYNKSQLRRLFRHLRISEVMEYSPRRYEFRGQHGLIAFLYWLRTGQTFVHMASYVFGGDSRNFGYIMRVMVSHLYSTFYHKMSGDSMSQWVSQVDDFRSVIYKSLSSRPTWLELIAFEDVHSIMDLSSESFRIFGFLDDYGVETSRPGDSVDRRHNFEHDIQRAFYSGYFRAHGLKVQAIHLPNGMVGSIFITSLAENDPGALNMSGLDSYLIDILEFDDALGGHPALYTDGVFPVRMTIIPRYTAPLTPAQHQFNCEMAGLRVTIEHMFGLHSQLFKLFRQKERLKLFHHAKHVNNLVFVCFFLLNCYQCIHQPMSSFGLEPPTLETYLPLNENLQTAPIVPDS